MKDIELRVEETEFYFICEKCGGIFSGILFFPVEGDLKESLLGALKEGDWDRVAEIARVVVDEIKPWIIKVEKCPLCEEN